MTPRQAPLDDEEPRATVGVFQDVTWASNGIAALLRSGLSPDALSVIAIESAEAAALIARVFDASPDTIDIAGVGRAVTHGPLPALLEEQAGDLAHLGLARTMSRVGFQAHDARIYEVLTARGGVLVAIQSESRAAEALAVLHAYGGGNAAIGAWTGRA